MTKEEAAYIIHKLSVAYTNFNLSEDNITLWFELLCDMPYEQVIANVKNHILENPFPPKISQISAKSNIPNPFLQKLNERLQLLNEYN